MLKLDNMFFCASFMHNLGTTKLMLTAPPLSSHLSEGSTPQPQGHFCRVQVALRESIQHGDPQSNYQWIGVGKRHENFRKKILIST